MIYHEPERITFGSHHNKPLSWYVVDEDECSYCLFAKECIDIKTFGNFDPGESGNYIDPDIRKFLLSLLDKCFNEKERNRLLTHDELNDKIFLLSAEEAAHLPYYMRCSGHWFWLRSLPRGYSHIAHILRNDGTIDDCIMSLSCVYVRPAMYIKKEVEYEAAF